MSIRKRPIHDIIADGLTKKLNDDELLALENRRKTAVQNQKNSGNISDINERIKRLRQYSGADDPAIRNNLRLKARFDPEFNVGGEPGPVVFLSKTLKGILITMFVLGALSITAIFYMTISNLKNHKYPGKHILWHNFRLR